MFWWRTTPYANVWEPNAIDGGTVKYSVSLIIPRPDVKTVAKIKTAIEAAYQEGQAKLKDKGRSIPHLSLPLRPSLRDGDVERSDDPAYANAATAPVIVDADRNPVLIRSEVHSGMYGRASISFLVTATILILSPYPLENGVLTVSADRERSDTKNGSFQRGTQYGLYPS